MAGEQRQRLLDKLSDLRVRNGHELLRSARDAPSVADGEFRVNEIESLAPGLPFAGNPILRSK